MKRMILSGLIVVLVLAGIALPAQTPTRAAGSVSLDFSCDALVVTGTTDQYGVEARVIVRWSGFPGTTRASGSVTVNPTGTQPFQLFVPITPALTNPAPAPFSPLDPDNMEQFFWVFGVDSSGAWTEDYFIGPGVCSGVSSIAGCDQMVAIPSQAVGGSFNQNAAIYYAPGEMVSPAQVIEAGNTARVLGVDATGQYYKIIWGCQYVWVPVETMGPNYDEVWNGQPLPTDVVE
jgi:hypothetical protein